MYTTSGVNQELSIRRRDAALDNGTLRALIHREDAPRPAACVRNSSAAVSFSLFFCPVRSAKCDLSCRPPRQTPVRRPGGAVAERWRSGLQPGRFAASWLHSLRRGIKNGFPRRGAAVHRLNQARVGLTSRQETASGKKDEQGARVLAMAQRWRTSRGGSGARLVYPGRRARFCWQCVRACGCARVCVRACVMEGRAEVHGAGGARKGRGKR